MDRIEPSQQSERASYRLFSPPAGETDDTARKRAWKGESFSFRDILDIVNPLQHLPVVSTLYRWITGDTIGAVPRMIGDAIYGGPIGFVTGLANAEVKQESGKDVGEQVIALLGGDAAAPAAEKTIAANEAPQGAGSSQPGNTASAAAGAVVAFAGPIQPSGTVAAATGPRAAPSLAAAVDPTDASGLFLARQNMLHRQLAADSGGLPGRALSNRVVPLQGIAVPAGLLRPSAPAAARAAHPVGPDDTGAPPTLPTNPPVDISQQMMDALDKYTRLQQQRGAKADAGRGAQLDLMQ
jgi:hypothetical protein